MIPFWLPFELTSLFGAASLSAMSLFWFTVGGPR